jgi:hypothetical protein
VRQCVDRRRVELRLPGYAQRPHPRREPFTISTFGSFNGEPSLSVDTGIDPELNEITVPPQAPKTFPWSLSLTVLGANGSTVYTENLLAKAAEAAQFCEGYAEP